MSAPSSPSAGTATAAELSEWQIDLKGAYNASDLNRVGAAVAYVATVVPEWDMRCHPGRWLWPKGIGAGLDGPIQWHCIAAPVWTKGSHP